MPDFEAVKTTEIVAKTNAIIFMPAFRIRIAVWTAESRNFDRRTMQ